MKKLFFETVPVEVVKKICKRKPSARMRDTAAGSISKANEEASTPLRDLKSSRAKR
ncbi:MAG TPA: hypothetical protein VFB28_00725 [Terriglobales bacterium]|jgi:hypothetical protein|nr:hypothetical protein [Terriglobales bacterium]